MTTPYIAEIQVFGFNFNPRGWAFCNGALLPIAQNTALFSLIGTQYGGNGQTTFLLPNFAARAACQQGTGPGLTPRTIGEAFGVGAVTLTANQLPVHAHTLNAWTQPDPARRASSPAANGGLSYLDATTTARTFVGGPPNTQLSPAMIQPNAAAGSPHENRQPYLGLNFCIALQGVYPSFP